MDISQITNYDSGTEITKEHIIIDGIEHAVTYKQYTFPSTPVYKFGYCCENRAINYPIFLEFNNSKNYLEFKIGSTGMFEFQPEVFKDINDDAEEKNIKINVTAFQAPFNDEKSEVKDPERLSKGFI